MSGRERLLLDQQWRFHRGDLPFPTGHAGWLKAGNFTTGPTDPGLDDCGWRAVKLPHDFIVEGEFRRELETPNAAQNIPGLLPGQGLYTQHGSRPTAVGWYRRTFLIPEADRGRRLWLEFDGVARDCRVWLNQHFLGRHLSGYTGFRFDITDVAAYGDGNCLVVRADATEYEGWFYEGGGIYRHVWLVKHPAVGIAPDGVVVTTAVTAGQATVTVRTTVRNDGDAAARPRLLTTIHDAAGRAVASATTALDLAPDAEATATQQCRLSRPRLWSVDQPQLYTAVSTLSAGREPGDTVRTTFGIRTIAFDPARGFLLNGQRVMLKGVCCHQDHAGVGVALPDALQEYRLRRLKDMGCNAYRCSHNPPTPELLDACDRLGMLVMDENRLLSSTPEGLGQLESLVRRDRNHPAVILWSLANEERLQGTDTGARIAATMKRLVRRLDPTRPVTMAMNSHWGRGLSAVVDVQGCNYIFCGDIDEFHRRFPTQPVLYSESCSTVSTRGIYATDAARGYVPAYDQAVPHWGHTAEANWRHCLARPWVAGTFVWTGFDYRGEPTPYGWPCTSSHFGILDLCGFPKDNFFYYQAWWRDRHVLHVFPHWNWPGREGQPIAVWVHTNADAVELFLNGVSLGRKKVRRARHLEWRVKYAPGVLLAKAWTAGKLVATRRVETTGAPTRLRLTPDRQTLHADGEDTTPVNVAVTDARGRVVPVADNQIRFALAGAGRLLGVGNGDPSSHEPDQAEQRRAFNGLCQVLVQAGRTAGELRLTAQADGLAPAELRLAVAPATPRPGVTSARTRQLREFQCSARQPAPARVAAAPRPKRHLVYQPVTTVTDAGFCDVRGFHGGKHSLLYIRATCQVDAAGPGRLAYGADGPVRVWVNGRAVACCPDATNPALASQYAAAVRWRQGANEIVFGLVTNRGRAWGVFARIVTAD